MTDNFKLLGQVSPPSGVESPLVVLSDGKAAVISSVFVCNATDNPITFRLTVRGSGDISEALPPEVLASYFLYHDLEVDAHDTFKVTAGFTISSGTGLYCSASVDGVAFNAFGTEVTP